MGGGFDGDEVLDIQNRSEDGGADRPKNQEPRHGGVGEAGRRDHFFVGGGGGVGIAPHRVRMEQRTSFCFALPLGLSNVLAKRPSTRCCTRYRVQSAMCM